MPRSPFRKDANATLTFTVRTIGATANAKGHPIATESTVVVKAVLAARKQNRLDRQPSEDRNLLVMIGWLTEPTEMPAGLVPGSVAKAAIEFDSTLGVNAREGTFTLLAPIVNPFLIRRRKTLNPILGEFRTYQQRGYELNA